MAKKITERRILTFYCYIQKKLEEHVVHSKRISIVDAKKFLGWYKIPKSLRYPILKEMERFELIKFISAREIEIVHTDYCDIIDDASKLYESMGLWHEEE